MEMRTSLSLEDIVSEPHEKLWQAITTGLLEGQRDLQTAQRTASERIERMFLRRIGIQEVHFDQDRQQADITVSFRLFARAAVLSNCIAVQPVDATTTQVRWDGRVTFPRGLEGWVLKRLYAFLLKKLLEEGTLEEVLGLTRK